MKITISIVFGFVLGFTTQYILTKQLATHNHWKAVHRYNEYMKNPDNHKADPSTGLMMAKPPKDILPDLAALVVAGEIDHADLVLPNVPYDRDSTLRYIELVNKQPDIVYATGNSIYAEFAPSGIQPIRLNIWYKNSNHSMIRGLIAELEATTKKESQQAAPSNR